MKLLKSQIKINLDKSELSELIKDAQNIKDAINNLDSEAILNAAKCDLLFEFCCEIVGLKCTTNNLSIEVNNLNINFDFEMLKKLYIQFIEIDKLESDIDFLTMSSLFEIFLLKGL